MKETVWIVSDFEETVAVAATEARAKRAAEDRTSAEVDSNDFGPGAEKRFRWNDEGNMSIFCPRPHLFTGVIHDWQETNLWGRSLPLLTDEPWEDHEPGLYVSTICVCGQIQWTVPQPAGNVFAAHNDKAGDPCPGLPLPFPPTVQEADRG